MVGERHIAFPVHPGGQVIGRSQRCPDGLVVAAGTGLRGALDFRPGVGGEVGAAL
jgi:hypothetical protein